MKKRVLSFILVIVLVLSLVGMIACDKEEPVKARNNSSSIIIGEDAQTSVKGTQRVSATTNQSFEIYTENGSTRQKASLAVLVKSANGVEQDVTVAPADSSNKYFKVYAPFGGYATGEWYEITLLSDEFEFVHYKKSNKVSFYVAGDGDVQASFVDDVVKVSSVYIANETVDEKGYIWFDYNEAASENSVEVGQVLITEDAEEGQKAYEITSKKVTDGIARCSAKKPAADDVYNELFIKETATLNSSVKENITANISENSPELKEIEEIAAAAFGFEAGQAKFNVSFDVKETDVVVGIDMTIPDLIKTESGDGYLDLTLSFGIVSEIDVLTDVSLGALVAAKDKGLTIEADINNTLSFNVKLSDTIAKADQVALDDILEKIAKMVKDTNESDIKIDIFNWVIPIGNGVASITYNADVVMDFAFSGELNVGSKSSLDFKATINYAPDSEDPVSLDLSKPTFTFDSIEINVAAELHTKIGLYNDISFDLLAGVIGLGIYAEVGNYNDLYGAIVTQNLLEELDASYGYYFEGGIYYDVGVMYNLANLVKGEKSFFDGDQKKPLYDFGHKYLVKNIKTTYFRVGPEPIPMEVYGDQVYILDGSQCPNSLIDATKFTIKENEYVEIIDGKLCVTKAGIDKKLDNYEITIYADGAEQTCYVTLIGSETVDCAVTDIAVFDGISNGSVTVKYLTGENVEFEYNPDSFTVTVKKDYLVAGKTIIISVNNIAQKIVYLK